MKDRLYIARAEIRNWILRTTQKPILNRLRRVGAGLVKPLRFPHDFNLTIGVTNICNARCTFCVYPRMVDNKSLKLGTMPTQLFKCVLDEWTQAGGSGFTFLGIIGDPLLDPKFKEKVDYGLSLNHDILVVTNGIALGRSEHWKILPRVGTVFISAPGMDSETYRELFRVDKYEEFLHGLNLFLAENRRMGEPARVHIGFRNRRSIRAIVKSHDFQLWIKPHLSKRVRCSFMAMYENWAGQITAEDTPNGRLNRMKLYRVPCEGTRSIMVRYDGKVYGCCCMVLEHNQDDLLLGKFPEQSLREIACSERFNEFFNSFRAGKPFETCSKCSNYNPIHWRLGVGGAADGE